jgi:hypothetical protein
MRVGELDLLPYVRGELLRQECWPQSIELSLLSIRQSRHQAQVIPQRVILTQGPQTLRAVREQARWVGQADAWDGPFGKRLNLGGI